jgi:hypothetical protein
MKATQGVTAYWHHNARQATLRSLPAVSLGVAAYAMRNERTAIARQVLPVVRAAMRSPWCAEAGRDPYNNGQLSISVAMIARLAAA